MRKLAINAPKIFVIGIVFLVSVIFCGSAWAAMVVVNVHGTSGHIEYADRIDYSISNRHMAAWGIDLYQKSGTANWIHYSIPMPYGAHTRYLALRFKTGSVDSWIDQIHVYNGRTKIYQSPSLGVSGDAYGNAFNAWYILDMGSDKIIDKGLGLSINVAAGVEMMSHRVEIYAVAGEYH